MLRLRCTGGWCVRVGSCRSEISQYMRNALSGCRCLPTILSSVREQKKLSAFFQKRAIDMQTAVWAEFRAGPVWLPVRLPRGGGYRHPPSVGSVDPINPRRVLTPRPCWIPLSKTRRGGFGFAQLPRTHTGSPEQGLTTPRTSSSNRTPYVISEREFHSTEANRGC